MEFELKTAVAFLVFNRPDTTQQVFEEIRRARPPKFFVVADGPRKDRAGENERCKAVRAIIDKVDWPCEVFKNYSDINLGCKGRVSSGIDWVFENVEEAIFLEDDCLPNPTFFRFCEEQLVKYKYDKQVFIISGNNNLFPHNSKDDYFFSKYPLIWGWATWKRVWEKYDVNILGWRKHKSEIAKWIDNIYVYRYWNIIFENVFYHKINTWDYQLAYSCFKNNGLNIISGKNLISNIGFQEGATHTSKLNNEFANLPCKDLVFPLSHPSEKKINRLFDSNMENKVFGKYFFFKWLSLKIWLYLRISIFGQVIKKCIK